MLKNPLYVYGEGDAHVPASLNFGQFMIYKLWKGGDNVALINGSTDQKLLYRDFAKNSMNLAISLHLMGIKKGDTIAICSENRKEYLSAVVGIMCTGAVVTPINMGYTKDEIAHVLSISKPKIIFCSPLAFKTHAFTIMSLRFLQIALFGEEKHTYIISYNTLIKGRNIDLGNFIASDVEGQTDTAVVLYSSGTTGVAKGVMLTHLNLLTTCCLKSTTNPTELALFITPWYHSMGLMGALRGLCTGTSILYLPKFSVNQYLETIERYQVAQLVVPPPVLVALTKTDIKYNIDSVKLIYSGAAPLREETIQAVKEKFKNVNNVLQGYGMTETTLAITRDTYETQEEGKGVGRVVTSCVVKILDIETNQPLGPNKPGEICVRGPVVMKGYIGKGREDDFDEEGFFKTGDIGYYDEDGYFFIVDRLKELIKYKGYQVAPAEIEAVLLQHPAIKDAGVVGVNHESGGEAPRAYVVIQPEKNISEDDVKRFVAERLSNPKHLRGGVRFIKEIPKNPSGKIMRKKLKELANDKSKL